MSELDDIKNRIFTENKIEEVLTLLECWSIDTEQKGNLFVAGLPDGDNPRSVQVKATPNLQSAIRSKGVVGSIFDVISYIVFGADTEEKRTATLHKSKYWVCTKLNYFEFIDDFYKETSDNVKMPLNYNKWLTKMRGSKASTADSSNQVLPSKILEQYGVIPYKKWLDEGLLCSTQRRFGVGIDVKSDRITFPVHNKLGDLVGIKARYCGIDRAIDERYKYLYLYPCNKSIELFNFHRALPYIKKKKEVIIVEGGKTTMFLTQWRFENVVSIEGDSLSDTQVSLLKELGLDIKYIFAFDKDKDAAYVKKEASKLSGRLKYGVLDIEDYLENKDSPCDKKKEVWESLYINHCYRI